MINSEDTTQLISLSRDCEVISVPYGEKEILKKAAIYKKQTKDKNFKPYSNDLD